jgi:anthranilate/para-aminobenzoate synthase component II
MIRRVLLIDNLDSFSFNLVESFQRLGCTVRTVRNGIDAGEALAMAQGEGR